jgi:SAM-dependent methyltransferase
VNPEQIRPYLKCTACGGGIEVQPLALLCEDCGHAYPIVDGIPRCVSSQDYSASFGYQWNIHAKTQVDKFNGLTISRDRLFEESQWTPEALKGRSVLECGSGSGRFTQVLCDCEAHVFSIDYSLAVEANQNNNHEAPNLFLAQASIYDLPFREKSFDFLVCLGVIQHTPDVKRAFMTMFKYLKPGGKFCVDVYAAPFSYLHPRHLLRPFTRKMNKEKLYDLVRQWVPRLLPVSTALHKTPVVGQLLARLVPVANWRANIRLPSESMYQEWALLDTFDWLSPAFEKPQDRSVLHDWCNELQLKKFDIVRQRGLYVIRGKK